MLYDNYILSKPYKTKCYFFSCISHLCSCVHDIEFMFDYLLFEQAKLSNNSFCLWLFNFFLVYGVHEVVISFIITTTIIIIIILLLIVLLYIYVQACWSCHCICCMSIFFGNTFFFGRLGLLVWYMYIYNKLYCDRIFDQACCWEERDFLFFNFLNVKTTNIKILCRLLVSIIIVVGCGEKPKSHRLK